MSLREPPTRYFVTVYRRGIEATLDEKGWCIDREGIDHDCETLADALRLRDREMKARNLAHIYERKNIHVEREQIEPGIWDEWFEFDVEDVR